MFEPVKNNIRVSKMIANQIEAKILRGELRPGDKLPSENELVEKFQSSRNTVREALRTLEASGLIKIKQGPFGGAFIEEFSPQFISDSLIRALKLGNVSISNLTQFRLAIEPYIAQTVASKGLQREIVSRLEENIGDATRLYKDNQVTGYKNMDFHVILAEATENPVFVIVLNTLRAGLNEITPIAKVRKSIRNSTIYYHKRILEAIKGKKPEEARQKMTQHLIELESVLKKMKNLET
ncbi:MAG: FadR/GntR family transcriptional regulator [Candidatus Hodarchaeota archaeon]